jgi:hypothetical protein
LRRIPGSTEVDRALRAAAKQVLAARKALNSQASSLLARGDYEAVREMLSAGQAISQFHHKVEALREEWIGIRNSSRKRTIQERTALWEYYQPILSCLVRLGGQASTRELLKELDTFLPSRLSDEDRALTPNGTPRWVRTVRRTRKAMIAEGFLEPTTTAWHIAPAGEQAVTQAGD